MSPRPVAFPGDIGQMDDPPIMALHVCSLRETRLEVTAGFGALRKGMDLWPRPTPTRMTHCRPCASTATNGNKPSAVVLSVA